MYCGAELFALKMGMLKSYSSAVGVALELDAMLVRCEHQRCFPPKPGRVFRSMQTTLRVVKKKGGGFGTVDMIYSKQPGRDPVVEGCRTRG